MSIRITENSAQAITANRLSDGFVVYLTAQDTWSERIVECKTASDERTAQNLLIQAQRHADEGHIVGPYLFKLALEDGKPVALGQREIIRTTGPSVGTDLARGENHVSL